MVTNRHFTQSRSIVILVGVVAVLGSMALAVNFKANSVEPNPAAGGPAANNLASQRSVDAYAARWTGLAGSYTEEQAKRAGAVQMQFLAGNTVRSVEAYAGRSAGLAELPSRVVMAYSARWAGLAEIYAPVEAYAGRWEGLARAYRQRAIDAYAARWAGLAETYAGK